MHIEINVGDGVDHSDALDQHIHKKLAPVERHFGDRLTRVEVFLKDVNSNKGGVDKQCTMEARPGGLKPVAVDAQAEDLYTATHDAAGKLEKALRRRIARVADRH